MYRFRALFALAVLSVPLFAQAQATRPDLMYCGSSNATGTELYLGVGPFNEVSGCSPTATTQAMLVTRSGTLTGQGAAWLDYLNNGGVIITEYSISDNVYNEIYGTAYAQGTGSGDCADNAMPSLKFNPDGAFWQAVQIPETAENQEACGFSLNAIVDGEADVNALGGWVSNGLVNFAERMQGTGVLYLLDADWQDAESSYTDDSRTFMGALISGGALNADVGTARFQVTKTFSDGSTGDIDVTLTCNGGTPLQQDFTISGGGPGVTFTVTNLPDAGANCEVTESGGVAGYTPVMNGGEGCSWTGVTGGLRSCSIENVPLPTAVEVVSGVVGADDPNIDDSFETVISCDGVSDTDNGPYGVVETTVTYSPFTANWYADPDGGADCTVTLMPMSSAAEGDTCEFSFMLGDEEAGCTVVATVFFEGIPTLSQYGMAIMVLLMLGVGFVGMRRFV